MKASSSLLLGETCRFKLEPNNEQVAIFEELLQTCSGMVDTCLKTALKHKITSRKRLHKTVYKELREKYSNYPSHYIYTAITLALVIFKSYRRLSRKRGSIKPPEARRLRSILLDDTSVLVLLGQSEAGNTQRTYCNSI